MATLPRTLPLSQLGLEQALDANDTGRLLTEAGVPELHYQDTSLLNRVQQARSYWPLLAELEQEITR